MKTIPDTPLFEEVPVDSAIRPPLAAPKSWSRIIVDRAKLRCECAGQCGETHAKSDGRCPRIHGGRYAKKDVVLVVAPVREHLLSPLSVTVALPDEQLMAWCATCESAAKRNAKLLAAK